MKSTTTVVLSLLGEVQTRGFRRKHSGKLKSRHWTHRTVLCKNCRTAYLRNPFPRPVLGGDCSCYCHLSSLNCESMGDGRVEKVLGEEGNDGSRCLIEATGQIDPGNIVKAELLDPTSVHSTDMMLANDKIVGILETKIVGRRYNRGTVCKKGMKVSRMKENRTIRRIHMQSSLEIPVGLHRVTFRETSVSIFPACLRRACRKSGGP